MTKPKIRLEPVEFYQITPEMILARLREIDRVMVDGGVVGDTTIEVVLTHPDTMVRHALVLAGPYAKALLDPLCDALRGPPAELLARMVADQWAAEHGLEAVEGEGTMRIWGWPGRPGGRKKEEAKGRDIFREFEWCLWQWKTAPYGRRQVWFAYPRLAAALEGNKIGYRSGKVYMSRRFAERHHRPGIPYAHRPCKTLPLLWQPYAAREWRRAGTGEGR